MGYQNDLAIKNYLKDMTTVIVVVRADVIQTNVPADNIDLESDVGAGAAVVELPTGGPLVVVVTGDGGPGATAGATVTGAGAVTGFAEGIIESEAEVVGVGVSTKPMVGASVTGSGAITGVAVGELDC